MKKNYVLKDLARIIFCSSILIANSTFAQWVNVSPPTYTNVELFDIKFVDDNTGIALGRDHVTEIGYIFKTSNGGTSWTTFTASNTFFRAAAFSSSVTANAGGYPTIPSSSTILYETFNAGTNWGLIPQALPYAGIEHMQFINSQDGFATGYGLSFGSSIGIYKTTNGGIFWGFVTSINGINGGAFFMTSPTTGYLTTYSGLNSGTIEKTTNGGLSFSSCYNGDWMKDVTFLNPTVGFGLEGLITASCIATTNGGTTWTTLGTISGDANAFIFSNSNDGWAVGGGGNISMTANGGVMWTPENSTTTENLNEITISPGYVWACGDEGTVLKRAKPATAAPIASFSFTPVFCTNTAKNFSDQSINSPNSWAWNITPSVGVNFNPSQSAQSPIVTFSNAGTYTVTLIAAQGTMTGTPYSTTVQVNPSPQLTVSASQNTTCVNKTVTLSASGASTFSWTGAVLNSTLATTSFTTGTTTGLRTFTVAGTTTQGCTSVATITVMINSCVGLEEGYSRSEIAVYPNPFDASFNIIGLTGTLEIYNSLGQFIKRLEVDQTINIDMSDSNKGLYFIKFHQAGTGIVTSTKIIKD